MKRILTGIFGLLLVVLAAGACGDEPPPPPPPIADFGVEVTTFDLNKHPMVKVPVLLDGKVVGYTDKDGVFKATIKERAGGSVTLDVGDLNGFRWTDTTKVTEELRVNSAGVGIPIGLNAVAESRFRDYMFWIQAKCENLDDCTCKGLSVSLNGEEVAKTDEFGYAHFTTSGVPQTDVTVVIDTPDANTLDADVIIDPSDPSYTVELGLESHVYLIEETFRNAVAGAKPRGKAKGVRKSKSKRRKGKKKKRKKKRKKKKKKKKKSNDPIDLW